MMRQVMLSDEKKEEIMNMLENQNTQKRRMPSVKALVLAAALAVGCVLSIAAGLPARVYNFVSGGTLTALPGTTGEISMTLDGEEIAPAKVEDGRLWFETDDQKVDITDLVNEDTPYIYEHTDPATGEKGYIIVGGTPEDFGWVEIVQMGNAAALTGSNYATVGSISLDDVMSDIQDGTFVYSEDDAESDGLQLVGHVANRPWLDTALDQLNLAEFK